MQVSLGHKSMSQALILPIVVRNKSVLVTSVLIQGPKEFHMEIPQAKLGLGPAERISHGNSTKPLF